jgi:hypothetical protein
MAGRVLRRKRTGDERRQLIAGHASHGGRDAARPVIDAEAGRSRLGELLVRDNDVAPEELATALGAACE